jgi:hypothetical protein
VRHLLISAAALLAFCSTQALAEEWEHSYAVNGKPEVVVNANDGDVEIVVGSSQQVEARVITHGWKINQELQVTGTQSGNRVELKLHHPHKGCFGFCFQSIRVELRVPRESDLNIHTGDGKLRADSIRGNLQLETNDGDIQIHDAEGSLHAETHDGNVIADGQFDFMSVHTGDGNVESEVKPSSTPQPGWSFRTGDGNLRLRLPGEFGADLDAHTGDGHVNIDFPLTTAGSTHENSIRGKINGGGIPIELSTGDGNIAVEKI